MEPKWSEVNWAVRVNGIADTWLCWLTLDGWTLGHGNPANGSLGIFPTSDGTQPTMADAQWIADVMAFDHDAPIDAAPIGRGFFEALPADRSVRSPVIPVGPFSLEHSTDYWENVRLAHGAAAANRFGASYTLRYKPDLEGSPSTDFGQRFPDERSRARVGLYAMAARQADLMSEVLCLWRVLEAADGGNGKQFAAEHLPLVKDYDFGTLRVVDDLFRNPEVFDVDAFEVYRRRAVDEIEELALANDVTDLAAHLYGIRNALAHGKRGQLVTGQGDEFMAAARALPIVKLLARVAVEPAGLRVAHR